MIGSPPSSGSSIIAGGQAASGDAGASIAVQQDGETIVVAAKTLNFVSGATVAEAGDTAAITITGGGGGGTAASVIGPWNASPSDGDTDIPMSWVNFDSGWVATRAGTINGISASHDQDPISAGTCNFHATINGVTTVVACVMQTGVDTPHADGSAVAFVAGDVLGIAYTASEDFSTGDGIDVAATLTVTLAASGS